MGTGPQKMKMKLLFKKIYLASDHRGMSLKTQLVVHLKKQNILDVEDLGPSDEAPQDYPDYAQKLCRAMEKDAMGILICNTGIGMSITANRFHHIRAALCCTPEMAQKARAHNDANILVLGGEMIGYNEAKTIVGQFIKTPFEGGRHTKRVQKINEGGPNV